MKITCESCQKSFNAADKYAGKRVKCPNCQNPIDLPELQSVASEVASAVDLNSLEAIEKRGEALVFERKRKPMTLKEAQAAAQVTSDKPAPPADPRIRICPRCSRKIRSEDIYVDLICSHCGTPIPGRELAPEEQARYMDSMSNRQATGVSFYGGFTGALIYPTRALPAILLGAGIAVAVIALPLLGILAFTASAGLNPLAAKEAEQNTAWVGMFLTAMFAIEGIYFGAVAYYVAIDVIRATTANNEQPPGLTWNIINLGAALGGYAALIAVFMLIVIALAGGVPMSSSDFEQLASPLKLGILALLTFGVPMNLIGLASSHALDGLNPVKVFRSIGRLVGHYIFLFLVVLIYLSINIAIMYALISWAWPMIAGAAQHGLQAGFLRMLGGVAAWGVVIAAGFYFAYGIGRVLGLFCRTYREDIDFEM